MDKNSLDIKQRDTEALREFFYINNELAIALQIKDAGVEFRVV